MGLKSIRLNIIVTIYIAIWSVPGVPGVCLQPKNHWHWRGLRIHNILSAKYYVDNVHDKLHCPKGVLAAQKLSLFARFESLYGSI